MGSSGACDFCLSPRRLTPEASEFIHVGCSVDAWCPPGMTSIDVHLYVHQLATCTHTCARAFASSQGSATSVCQLTRSVSQEFEVEESKAQTAGLVVKTEEQDASAAVPNSDHADLQQLANQTVQANTGSLLAESEGKQDAQETKGILNALRLKSSKTGPASGSQENRDQELEEFEKQGFFGLLNKLELIRDAKVTD